jgi:hypothetical protein
MGSLLCPIELESRKPVFDNLWVFDAKILSLIN